MLCCNMHVSILPPAVDNRHIKLLLGVIFTLAEKVLPLQHAIEPMRFVVEQSVETAVTHPSIQVVVCVVAFMRCSRCLFFHFANSICFLTWTSQGFSFHCRGYIKPNLNRTVTEHREFDVIAKLPSLIV